MSTKNAVLSRIQSILLHPRREIEAILLVGSTAFKPEFGDWDDFDIQVYTRHQPARESYYEILNGDGKHYMLSAYYFQLDPAQNPTRGVVQQKDVKVLFGRRESLQHIFVHRPRRTEPLSKELGDFRTHYERYFEILVDVFFILSRYEAKGKTGKTGALKPHLARDALRTLGRHFYKFYGVDCSISNRTSWRNVLRMVIQLLDEKKFENKCQNRKFVTAAIDMMTRYI